MRDYLQTGAGFLFSILMFGFGLFQLGAGWTGIEHQWGWGWGVAAVAAALLLDFTIPIVIGCYLCAHEIWGWNWFFSIIFAMPGLIFMIPGIISSLFDAVRQRA